MSQTGKDNKNEQDQYGSTSYIIKKIFRNPSSLGGLVIIIGMSIIAIISPYVAPYHPDKNFWDYSYGSPNTAHIMGTDHLGRDVFSRVLIGARASLIIGIGATLLVLLIGVPLGAIVGYYGGLVDNIIMKFTDILLTFPSIFLLIILVSVFSVKGIGAVILSMGVLGWMSMCRVVRGQFLSLKEATYVKAARGLGYSNKRIIFRHILPNTLSPILVMGTLRIGTAIMSAAGLSFLGLMDPSIIMWGTMVNLGLPYMSFAWWISTFPGLFIFITVLGFNLLGDGLRDVFDVKRRGLRE